MEPNSPPSPVPVMECGSDNSAVNPHPFYPFLPTPMIPFDPMFTWPYPSVLYDPGFWAWVVDSYPLGGLGPVLTNHGLVGSPSWMMNPGQPGMVPSPPVNVSPSSTPVEAGPTTVAPKVTAVEEQESRNGRQADTQNPSEPVTLELERKWEGCTYTGTFGVKSSLRRHVDATRISPDSFKCPAPRCKKSFGRRDKYTNHLRSTGHDRLPE